MAEVTLTNVTKRFGDFTAVDDVIYNVKVYDDFIDGELQNELSSEMGTINYYGYHTIDIDEPFQNPIGIRRLLAQIT